MTKIAWTNKTWNPIVGCSKISRGCENCYAEKMAQRLRSIGIPHYEGVVDADGWTGHIEYAASAIPPKRGKCFVCSMSDLFHEKVPEQWHWDIFNDIWQRPLVTWQILTKRPDRMAAWFEKVDRHSEELGESGWLDQPNPNIWLGTTVEEPSYNHRIAELLRIPAAVRFVSMEPLLGPPGRIPGLPHGCCNGHECACMGQPVEPPPYLDWVIVGAESGPNRRPCPNAWIRSVVQQCQQTGTPVFVKQTTTERGNVSPDPYDWPADLRVQEFPQNTP